MIDKRLDTFTKYQAVILKTARVDYLLLSFVTMILGVSVLYFVITQVHHKQITQSTLAALFCIFPGPIILAFFVSFLSYLKNRSLNVTIETGCLIYKDKRYGYDSIRFIELLGPYVINVQMRNLTCLRFVSDDLSRNKTILEKIRKIKPDVHLKRHIMGKIDKNFTEFWSS